MLFLLKKSNYNAKIVRISDIRKHPNADSLNITYIDFTPVIIGKSIKIGDVCVYFPPECKINKDFLSFINAFRKNDLNKDKSKKGYFEENCRVRVEKIRGERSLGFIVPKEDLEKFSGIEIPDSEINKEFDTIGDILICEKYVVPRQRQIQIKEKKKITLYSRYSERESRIYRNLINLHVDTGNLRKNIFKFNPETIISISYKLHGTSFWVSHIQVKRKLTRVEKILKWFGVKIDESEHDYIYGSRRVIKNEFFDSDQEDLNKSDIWKIVMEEVKGKFPAGFTIYGEIVGFFPDGRPIQISSKRIPYDYGLPVGRHKIYIYRVTFTNNFGEVYNLSTNGIIDFCNYFGFNHVPYFFRGRFGDLFPEIQDNKNWHEKILYKLEEKFDIEKDCYMCSNRVPREGIVIRRETPFVFEPYKLKSFRFFEDETKILDSNIENIEEQ